MTPDSQLVGDVQLPGAASVISTVMTDTISFFQYLLNILLTALCIIDFFFSISFSQHQWYSFYTTQTYKCKDMQ